MSIICSIRRCGSVVGTRALGLGLGIAVGDCAGRSGQLGHDRGKRAVRARLGHFIALDRSLMPGALQPDEPEA